MKLPIALLWATILIGCTKSQPCPSTSGSDTTGGTGTSPCPNAIATIDTAAELASLAKATAAIRDAFARGDVDAIVALHHPAIVKDFGGNNVVVGREAFRKGLISMLKGSRMEFIGNQIENTVFSGNVAIQTSIFTIRNVPTNGGKPTVGKGRSMVVYVKDKTSPTGWLSLREMAQEAP